MVFIATHGTKIARVKMARKVSSNRVMYVFAQTTVCNI